VSNVLSSIGLNEERARVDNVGEDKYGTRAWDEYVPLFI
jgi:hypothetical protein